MSGIVVFGGYGTFGRLVARGLVERGLSVVIAGRNVERAQAFAASLEPIPRACRADVADIASARAAMEGQAVAVHCAGPFNASAARWLDACLEAGCHAVDLADDRAYAAVVLAQGGRFRERGLAAVTGCSSLPGLSGALALLARERATAEVERAAVSLFIGNANPKGKAAIESLLRSLGKPIAAPQGTLHVFRDRTIVPLPAPFGQRAVYNFESPEYDLFPRLLETPAVTVRVGFEMRLANILFATLAALPFRYGSRTATMLERCSRPFSKAGHSGGAVLVELFCADGSVSRASLSAPEGGQRMAALPCVLAAEALARGTIRATGSLTAYELLGARALCEQMASAGLRLELSVEPGGQPR